MSVGSGGQGTVFPGFSYMVQIYYIEASAIFGLFLLFGLFSVAPSPWKRLNSAIFCFLPFFGIFFFIGPPGSFYVDDLEGGL